MSNIPTAEEFFYSIIVQSSIDENGNYSICDIQEALIEFAKLHVEAALKAASKKAELECLKKLIEIVKEKQL
jgi:hypothetical protein